MFVILKIFDNLCRIGEVVEQKWEDLVDTFQRKEKSGQGAWQ